MLQPTSPRRVCRLSRLLLEVSGLRSPLDHASAVSSEPRIGPAAVSRRGFRPRNHPRDPHRAVEFDVEIDSLLRCRVLEPQLQLRRLDQRRTLTITERSVVMEMRRRFERHAMFTGSEAPGGQKLGNDLAPSGGTESEDRPPSRPAGRLRAVDQPRSKGAPYHGRSECYPPRPEKAVAGQNEQIRARARMERGRCSAVAHGPSGAEHPRPVQRSDLGRPPTSPARPTPAEPTGER